MKPIFLDHASTTPIDPVVAAVMSEVLKGDLGIGNPPSGTHAYGRDAASAIEAARAWAIWEGSTSFLHSNEANARSWGEDRFALAVARIECHYFVNGGFLDSEDQLLREVPKIRHIPAVIVQGRYDVVCPMMTAWALHRAWPEADFKVVSDAGHSALEAGITDELVRATDRFAGRGSVSTRRR